LSYIAEISEGAENDLRKLIASLPADRQYEATWRLAECFVEIAEDPIRKYRNSPNGEPAVSIEFVVGDTRYYWEATFQFSQDETQMIFTHVYRLLY
jgi:hypothetical protein